MAARITSLEENALAAVLASTSTSSIAGLLTADLAWRTRAAERLAGEIIGRLDLSRSEHDARQIALPF